MRNAAARRKSLGVASIGASKWAGTILLNLNLHSFRMYSRAPLGSLLKTSSWRMGATRSLFCTVFTFSTQRSSRHTSAVGHSQGANSTEEGWKNIEKRMVFHQP